MNWVSSFNFVFVFVISTAVIIMVITIINITDYPVCPLRRREQKAM